MYCSLKSLKNYYKTPILGVQGHSTRSKSVSICNHSCARLVDSSRNRTFSMGYPNLMCSYGGLIEPRSSNLTPLKCRTFQTQVVLVHLQWFRRNSVLKYVLLLLQPKIAENSLKSPILGVQGRSRSSMLVPLESSSAVLVMISSKSVSICNHFHVR